MTDNQYKLFCKLQKMEIKVLKKNPHCISYFCFIENIKKRNNNNKNGYRYNKEFTNDFLTKNHIPKKSIKDFTQYKNEKIILLDDIYKLNIKNKMIYIPRKQKPSTTLHLGQLKLFLSTLQFLLYYAPKNEEVHIIYPGSAHGYNIIFLTELFPQCRWYLIDPGNFYKELYHNSKIVYIKKSLFTDTILNEVKEKTKNKFTLLISDIRLTTDNKSINRDHSLQKYWTEIIKPNYAQLKFRIPRDNENYSYLDGKIYLQMFAPVTSTETRLVVDGKNISNKIYNLNEYEGLLSYFNRILRTSYYKHYQKNECIDHCYDCSSMIYLLQDYKKKYKENPFSKLGINNMIEHLLTNIPNVKNRFCKNYNTTLENLL